MSDSNVYALHPYDDMTMKELTYLLCMMMTNKVVSSKFVETLPEEVQRHFTQVEMKSKYVKLTHLDAYVMINTEDKKLEKASEDEVESSSSLME